MDSAATGFGAVHQLHQGRIAGKGAILDGFVDAGEVLINDPARAEVHVPNLGVAHLAIRQAHR
ncbi:hypothetical protein D3C79_948470 [compost metagenome]